MDLSSAGTGISSWSSWQEFSFLCSPHARAALKMFSLRKAVQLASLLAIPASCHPFPNETSYVSTLPKNSQSLFTESMAWMDGFYDPSAGYLFDESSATALRHETRSSAWYAIGLLGRNEGDDVKNALEIITNVIHGQYKDPAKQWLVCLKHEVGKRKADEKQVWRLRTGTRRTYCRNCSISREDLQQLGPQLARLHWHRIHRRSGRVW